MTLVYYLKSSIHNLMDYMGRYRLIKDRLDEEPYLERYYVFLKNREFFPFNIFVHKFLKSDPDDFHDHPWSFISIPLWPGYWEHTPDGKFWRKPLSIRQCSAETSHRIELKGDYCWTLFLPGKQTRDWGFYTEEGWVQNDKYLKKKKS